MRVVQWLLLVASVAGLVWTGVLAGFGTLQDADTPQVGGVAVALILLVGGVGLGLLLALLCRFAAAGAARRRAEAVDERLRGAVAEVSHELVVDPVEIELAAYTAVRNGLARALA